MYESFWILLAIQFTLLLFLASIFCYVIRKWRHAHIVRGAPDESLSGNTYGLQFRLRTLFIFVTFLGLALGISSILLKGARQQSQIANRINSIGGITLYDFEYDFPDIRRSKPNWKPVSVKSPLFRLLGNDLWSNIVYVQFDQLTDKGLASLAADLEKLEDLHHLYILQSRLTAKSLQYLGKFRQLSLLQIDESEFNKSDVDALRNVLPNCEVIINFDTKKKVQSTDRS